MTLAASTAWEIRPAGSDANGGGFNPGNSSFATDLAATSATGASPVVTSASYTFVAGDVGSWLFIAGGTNWTKGWYQIASVSAGAATLTAGVGTAQLYGGATVLNTAAGCASVASPTSGTWSIDYSQQNAAAVAFTDMVIDGTTNTKFTSVANPVGKNFVGNLINVASGTGFTVQTVEVVSVTGTTATCDKSLGTLSSTGGTGNLGGAMATITACTAVARAGNKVFCVGSFTFTATQTVSGQDGGASATSLCNRLIGYGTYRGDDVKATITLSTNTGLTALNVTKNAWIISNFTINCASLGTSTGIAIAAGGAFSSIRNCKVSNFTTLGISVTQNTCAVSQCEVTGGTSAGTAGIKMTGSGNTVNLCYVHDNACPGINVTTNMQVIRCLVTNNTGASSDGIQCADNCLIWNCTAYGNGRHGINNTTAFYEGLQFRNNIVVSNGGFGIKASTTAGVPASTFLDGNAYYNNTSGAKSNMDDVGTTNAINGVAPYVRTLDVTLTGDPFTSSSTGDFTLNNTAGAGAACRAAGIPGAMPGVSQVGYLDMGVFQHQDPSGGAKFF